MALLGPSDQLTVITEDANVQSRSQRVADRGHGQWRSTGAGISAESGIPTFRGPEGYWTVGSKEYHPQEMATNRLFRQQPWDVWQWYLYRTSVCARAKPNRGHAILVELEQRLQDRFLLITQNVDNLHILAGKAFLQKQLTLSCAPPDLQKKYQQ